MHLPFDFDSITLKFVELVGQVDFKNSVNIPVSSDFGSQLDPFVAFFIKYFFVGIWKALNKQSVSLKIVEL